MKKYFVTAIGTDSGKTLVSAILTQALHADYWKPIQSGNPKDADRIAQLISNSKTKIHESAYFFEKPASPHDAAASENRNIHLDQVLLPQTTNHLVIEGAGGVLVPLNNTDFVIDIAQKLDCELILVSNLYLGSINHTLLTFRELERRNLSIKGIIFNGNSNKASQEIILKHTRLPCLLEIDQHAHIDQELIGKYAKKIADLLL